MKVALYVRVRRPALDALAARRGEFDVVICWRLDRLGCSLKHLLDVLHELTALGIAFVSLNALMPCEARYLRPGRHVVARRFVLATVLLAAACGREPSVNGEHPGGPDEVVKIDDVDIRTVDSRIIVQYRTRTSIRDCDAQAAKMPEVWKQVVTARIRDIRVQRVFLFPEDTSGQSVAIEFTKSASEQWSAAAPCSIRIPAG